MAARGPHMDCIPLPVEGAGTHPLVDMKGTDRKLGTDVLVPFRDLRMMKEWHMA